MNMASMDTTKSISDNVVLAASYNNQENHIFASQFVFFLHYDVPKVHPIDISHLLPSLNTESKGNTEPVYVDDFNRLAYDSNRMEFGKMYKIMWNDNKLGLMKTIRDSKIVIDWYEFESDECQK